MFGSYRRRFQNKSSDISSWSPERQAKFMLTSWEKERQKRYFEQNTFSFIQTIFPAQECYTPTGPELLKLQKLIEIALTTPLQADPLGLPARVQQARFSVRDPFKIREAKMLEDEPLFTLEKVSVEEEYLIGYGYMQRKLYWGNLPSSWYIDPKCELEKYLTTLAKTYLPSDFKLRKHLF